MKSVIIFFTLFLISDKSTAQTKSDLYLHVDSLIKYDLNFDPRKPIVDYESLLLHWKDTAKIYVSDSSLLAPLILINGYAAELEKLNRAVLNDVKKITVIKSPEVATLYGYKGVYGVIVITGKKKLSKNILKK